MLFTGCVYFTDSTGFGLDKSYLKTFGRLTLWFIISVTKTGFLLNNRFIQQEHQQQLTLGWRHVITAPSVRW